jgi:hypothetical protein
MKANWLYFDIPYAEGSSIMRAHYGYTDHTGAVQAESIYPLRDIPGAIERFTAICKEKNVTLGKDVVYVYPLDMRHALAGIVLEQSEKNGCGFSRQIPKASYPSPGKLLLYSPFDDGSAEIKLDQQGASARIMELEAETDEEFSYGDMLPVLGKLRYTLRLSVTHFGWNHPATMNVIVNFILACKSTGNDENLFESFFVVRQLVHGMRTTGSKSAWAGYEALPGELADALNGCGEFLLAGEVISAYNEMN